MKKTLLILLPIIAVVTLIVIYAKKFIKGISFDIDFELQIQDYANNSFVVPLKIIIGNTNSRGITARDVNISVLDKNGILVAKSEVAQDFNIEANKITIINHKFRVVDAKKMIQMAKDKYLGGEIEIKVVTSMRVMLIPITISEIQKF